MAEIGRMYATVFSAVAVTLAQDLFELLAGTGKPIRIHALFISQSSDSATTESEMLRLTLKRATGAVTSGSGGSTHTPVPVSPNDTASGATSEINNTTRISGGTITIFHDEAFNVLSGFAYVPTPEMRPVIDAATRLVVGLETAPADSLTMSGTLYFEELV